jgi:hypothetical protein
MPPAPTEPWSTEGTAMSASPSLSDFLVRLSQEPDLHAAFKADPSATMQQAGLSQTDHDLVLGQDVDQIRAAVEPSLGSSQAVDFADFII